MANDLDACQHTIIKYVTRFREKGGVQDLEKAKHVIDMLIEFEMQDSVSDADPCGDPPLPRLSPRVCGHERSGTGERSYSISLIDAITRALREEVTKREANGKT